MLDAKLDLDAFRASAHGQKADKELKEKLAVAACYDCMIHGRNGGVHVWVYRPFAKEATLPVVINAHGGGFVLGYRGQDEILARDFACHTGCVVIDIDYSTAPEHPFPYALHEVYDVIRYVYEHPKQFGIDPERMVLAGESAGGNLITAAALMNQTEPAFHYRMAVPIYPPLDNDGAVADKRFARDDPEGFAAKIQRYTQFTAWLAQGHDTKDPLLSPSFATIDQLKGLSPFLVVSGELDILGEEDEQFAAKLIEAGVTVTCKRVKDANHGFIALRRAGYEEGAALIFRAIREAVRNEE